MPIQDITEPIVFNNGYVKELTSELGLGSNASSVDMVLIYDTEGQAGPAQVFNEADFQPGKFYRITCGSLDFAGLVQSWRKQNSTSGETYNVRLSDPRLLFDNIFLILDGKGPTLIASGTEGVDAINNIINVYDYYGNDSDAQYDRNGMTWNKIKAALQSDECYIQLFDYKFKFAFDDNFIAPDYIRINADNLSLNQLLSNIAEILGLDYHCAVELTFDEPEIATIYVRSIKRSNEVTGLESIKTYLDTKREEGVLARSSYGQELKIGPTDTIVLGANKNYITAVTSVDSYYGQTKYGDILTDGTNIPGYVTFEDLVIADTAVWNNLPTLNIAGLTPYPTNAGFPLEITQFATANDIKGYRPTQNVMRAALFSQTAWEAMLFKEQPEIAAKFGIPGIRIKEESAINAYITDARFQTFQLEYLDDGAIVENEEVAALLQYIYARTREAADNYYGRTFLVSLPLGYSPSDTYSSLNYRFGYKVVDSAWYENASLTLKQTGNTRFRDREGKIRGHVLLSNIRDTVALGIISNDSYGTSYGNTSVINFDLASLSPDSYLIDGTDGLFVVDIEQNESNLGQAIIRLEAPVTIIETQGIDLPDGENVPASYFQFWRAMGYSVDVINETFVPMYENNKEYGLAPKRVTYFDQVRIPIEDEFAFYGPYFKTSTIHAGTKIIYDSSIAPWTYNSYSTMDEYGQAIADYAGEDRHYSDSANFTLAGLPEKNLGELLGENAMITNLSIDFGAGGLTTSYALQNTMTPIGRLSKALNLRTQSNAIAIRKQDQKINTVLQKFDRFTFDNRRIDKNFKVPYGYVYKGNGKFEDTSIYSRPMIVLTENDRANRDPR